jgi:hypothetical protein
MRKRLIGDPPPATPGWLDLEDLAAVEITSEDSLHPIESALLPGKGSGWQAALPGTQTIRLLFTPPQTLRRIRLSFVETTVPRTQEYLLRWSADAGRSFHEIVRQQWNFSPLGATAETEEHAVDLAAVNVLELIITPDIGNENGFASLAELRIA